MSVVIPATADHREAQVLAATDVLAEEFQLAPEQFERWWERLLEDDRQEFMFMGGDMILARFVCILDYFLIRKIAEETIETMMLAYAKAARIPKDSQGIRNRAIKARKHDATMALLDRVRTRNINLASSRTMNQALMLIESMIVQANLPDTCMKDKFLAAQAAISFAKFAADDEKQQRKERSKNALASAREAMTGTRVDDMDPAKLESVVKMALKHLPPEKVEALLKEIPALPK